MADQFSRALAKVLVSEGGYSNDPVDPGGATNHGITQNVYDAWRLGHGSGKQSVKYISDDEVATIYRANYWNAVQGDQLPPGVSYVVFDGAVNSGVSRSAKWLQTAVKANPDGQIGPATLRAVKAFKDADALVDAICDVRLAFLKSLPTWGHFGNGWSTRVASVRAAGKAWAS